MENKNVSNLSAAEIKKIEKRIRKTFVVGVILMILTATVLVFAFPSIVPTESMYPTVGAPSLNLMSVISPHIRGVKRGDVVSVALTLEQCLETNTKANNAFCKRVIGLPGEKVEIKDGLVYINDSAEPLTEPYLPDDYVPTGNYGPFEVPEGCLFLMGDNRNNSKDSRVLENRFFLEKNVVGIYWMSISKDGINCFAENSLV